MVSAGREKVVKEKGIERSGRGMAAAAEGGHGEGDDANGGKGRRGRQLEDGGLTRAGREEQKWVVARARPWRRVRRGKEK